MSRGFDRALEEFAESPSGPTMGAVATAVVGADVPELARLARVLSDSGAQLGSSSPDVVDIASSGGPGSLSTLLAPLYACALGARVAKIAVPGRPAGGVDVLASLPGYRSDLDGRAAREALHDCGYVHVTAGGDFCPLDAGFFEWRQQNRAQAVPELTITSLLAKKVAAGVGRVVLDIRVGPYGNLGTTAEEGRRHAEQLVAVAAELEIDAICVLTGASGAPQPWIGRGEALLALSRVLDQCADEALRQHADQCLQMALLVVDADEPLAAEVIADRARRVHESMLIAHGADPQAFQARVREVAAAPRHELDADRAGALRVELGELRRVLVDRQRAAMPREGAGFPDPCGVHLGGLDGASVAPGAVLARVRDDVEDPERLAARLAPHVVVVDAESREMLHMPMEIVRG